MYPVHNIHLINLLEFENKMENTDQRMPGI